MRGRGTCRGSLCWCGLLRHQTPQQCRLVGLCRRRCTSMHWGHAGSGREWRRQRGTGGPPCKLGPARAASHWTGFPPLDLIRYVLKHALAGCLKTLSTIPLAPFPSTDSGHDLAMKGFTPLAEGHSFGRLRTGSQTHGKRASPLCTPHSSSTPLARDATLALQDPSTRFRKRSATFSRGSESRAVAAGTATWYRITNTCRREATGSAFGNRPL